ncbi:MAG: anaerobic ribonucleoside-triphosphate reductase activating protein [Minisyncoccia bacterium]
MIFGGLQELTLIDYPGKIAATVFTIGCNFRCYYCHNPELVLPEKIKNTKTLSEEEVLNFLKERQGLLQGLCITGGEPTLDNGLLDFIKQVKALNFLVKLDTNGSNPEVLKKLLENKLLDYIAMDIKAPLAKYAMVAGVEIDLNYIQESIKLVRQSGLEYEFRTTIAPGLTAQDILDIVPLIKGADNYYLQVFHDNGKCLKDVRYFGRSLTAEELLLLKEKLVEHFTYVAVRE